MNLPLDEKIAALAAAFRDADIPYAIGGALALAHYAEPRATIDIDVNMFLEPDGAGAALDAIAALGVSFARGPTLKAITRDGQVRIRWGHTPLDLFFATDAFHQMCSLRVRDVPFGPDTITILSPEDLVVFKATFDRRKDWLDIEQVLVVTAGEFDPVYIRDWLERTVGADDPRLEKLAKYCQRYL